MCVVENESLPAAVRYQTYRPVLLIADPFVGSVHPDGVVDVTAPSQMTSRNRPAVGVNAAPPTTVPVDAGLIVCEVVPLRAAAIVT